jgi:hypothetical protein
MTAVERIILQVIVRARYQNKIFRNTLCVLHMRVNHPKLCAKWFVGALSLKHTHTPSSSSSYSIADRRLNIPFFSLPSINIQCENFYFPVHIEFLFFFTGKPILPLFSHGYLTLG